MVRISLKKELIIFPSNFKICGSIIRVENNDAIDYDNHICNDYTYLLEDDFKVVKYYEQSMKIVFVENDEFKEYIPSFYVEYINQKNCIVDLKSKFSTENEKSNNSKIHSIMESFCKLNNLDFILLSEGDINNDLLENIKFLNYYRNPLIQLNHDYEALLFNKVAEKREIVICDLIDEVANSEDLKAELIYVLWYMVSYDLLSVDKNCKLTMKSIVKVDI